MAFQLRTWTTTNPNISIPYIKLNVTRAVFQQTIPNNLNNPNKCAMYVYQPDTLIGDAKTLAPRYLNELRWVARKVMEGWNPVSAVAFQPAGSFKFKSKTGGELGTTFGYSHSPGTMEWVNSKNGGYEFMIANGAKVPNWMGSSQCLRFRPYPNELFGWQKETPQSPIVIGRTIGVTSDNFPIVLQFNAYYNALGWQVWKVVSGNIDSSAFPFSLNDIESTLISSSDQGEEGATMARFNPRTQTSTVGCYIMTKDEVREFEKSLWTTDLIDSIRNSFIGDGSNALLGVRWYYGLKDVVAPSTKTAYITLGNVAFKNVPKVKVALREFVEFDAGSIAIPQFYGDYRDWTITTYQAYLPFIGVIDLNPQDVVGKTLYLKYWINITDGSAVCTLSTTPTTPNGTGTLFTTTCSWGYDIPVRVDSAMDSLARMAKLTSAIPVVGSSVSGMFGNAGSYSSGELSPNSNVMGDFQPKVVIYRREDLSGATFSAANGAPGAGTTTVGAATGYLKVSEVYNAGSLAMRRAGEIIAMLKEGVYI